ncbi:hypothetical protein DSL72_007905 [Monilinia vaccinii-corymbosi]|uniref:Sur7 protein n=1 Tax=Monilinia vaccinii-corymbosi TaxID=61207 RepID=A0A8A3PIE4_9HELO|nr:hypothetical protein DSL72_007905 [Monilinia vaccinii-corymbosi]
MKIFGERKMPIRRLHALLPLVFSTISFTLGVITIFSGSNGGVLEDYYFMRLKTANLGQNFVEFAPVNSTTAKTTSVIDISAFDTRSTPADSIAKRDEGSQLITALFGNAYRVLKSIGEKIKAGNNDGLNEAANALFKNITDTMEIADFYSLHIMKMCQGTITADQKWVVNSCSNYSTALNSLSQLGSYAPSTFRVVNTTLTIPLLGLAATSIPFTSGILNIGTVAIIALYGLALIGSGATIVLSAIYMFKPSAKIVYLALIFSFLASNFTMTVTLNLTAVVSMIGQMISLVGPALGVQSSAGTAFLASSWVATVLALVFNQYWMVVWLVEIRAYGFRRRIRTDEEVGNWKEAIAELKRDWKKPEPVVLHIPGSNEDLMVERSDETTTGEPKGQPFRTRTREM